MSRFLRWRLCHYLAVGVALDDTADIGEDVERDLGGGGHVQPLTSLA